MRPPHPAPLRDSTVVVGLTGGIASGKSSVSQRFLRLGAWIVDADRIARQVVEPGTPGLRDVVLRFGPDVLLPDGSLDRGRLGTLVFADPQALAALNGLLHPRIVQRVAEECVQARRDGIALVVVDAALLFELGLDRQCDATVLVDCTADQQVERLMRDRGLDATQARQRLAAQWAPEARRALASLVLDNRGTLADLDVETLRVWNSLQALVQARQTGASST